MTAFALIVVCVLGCGQKTPNYTPTTQTATEAVRLGLEAWKRGHPAGDVTGTSPLVHVTDGGRKPDQILESFEILGESRGSSGKTVAVTLHLTNPTEDIKARYVVIGIDPLWVFRQEDFDLLMHWDHHMPAKPEDGTSENAVADPSNVKLLEPEKEPD